MAEPRGSPTPDPLAAVAWEPPDSLVEALAALLVGVSRLAVDGEGGEVPVDLTKHRGPGG
jgi:hypothetical protein